MSDWKPIYACWRPETKSKASHAKCRQYIFETTAELQKWLRARRNSEEWIRVTWCPTAALKDEHTTTGTRSALSKLEGWPIPDPSECCQYPAGVSA